MSVAIMLLLVQEEKSLFPSSKSRKERFKHTSISLHASSSAWWGDRKDKRGKQREGGGYGDAAGLFVAMSRSEIKAGCLYVCLSAQPFTEWGETTLTSTWGTGPNGVLNRLGAAPRHYQHLPWLKYHKYFLDDSSDPCFYLYTKVI